MAIREKLDILFFNSDFEAIIPILSKVTITVTNWGSRLVSVDGYTGTITLKELIFNLYHKTVPLRDRSSQRQSKNGLQLYTIIDSLYNQSEAIINSSIIFFRFFVWVRDFFLFPRYALFCIAREEALDVSRHIFVMNLLRNNNAEMSE